MDVGNTDTVYMHLITPDINFQGNLYLLMALTLTESHCFNIRVRHKDGIAHFISVYIKRLAPQVYKPHGFPLFIILVIF